MAQLTEVEHLMTDTIEEESRLYYCSFDSKCHKICWLCWNVCWFCSNLLINLFNSLCFKIKFKIRNYKWENSKVVHTHIYGGDWQRWLVDKMYFKIVFKSYFNFQNQFWFIHSHWFPFSIQKFNLENQTSFELISISDSALCDDWYFLHI